ncbi:MAG: UDP-3-O-(3-hydroxymyristoyl)glucosamine N-acyltransferase, partial [Planctomycetota bacterium]
MHIQELAKQLGAAVDPAADVDLTGVATIEEAGPGDVTFLANPRYAGRLRTCNAGAVFVTPGLEEEVSPVRLAIDNPYLAFAKAIALFHAPPATDPGVHPTAVLGEGVTLGVDVSIGAYVVLGKDVEVGDRTVIHPHCTVYEGARIGANCLLHSHTVVREHVRLGDGVILQNGAVVGSDGFGFAPRADKSLHKIPQAGTVELADEVEVQANACIDRA